jgi:hypothetical protein
MYLAQGNIKVKLKNSMAAILKLIFKGQGLKLKLW